MDIERYCNFLLTHMSNAHYASGKSHINCRCPECGDSKDPRHAHMYISVPNETTGEPSLYYCHKCGTKGIVNYKKFIEWNIFDRIIVDDLEMFNKTLSHSKSAHLFDNIIYSVSQNYIRNDQKTLEKVAYINNRLGVNLSINDIRSLKIVLNLNDLIQENHINKLTRNPNIVNQLDREFIGFLSVDNAFINMRRTCDEGIVYKSIDKRYINYVLFNKYDNSKKFYTIPTVMDISSPYRTKIHISEGPFDILSVYLNCRDREPGIYTSVTGNKYLPVLLYFMMDLSIPYTELHFYPDNDKFGTNERIMSIVNQIPDPTIPVYIHRNIMKGEKDFGVPRDRIIENVTILRGEMYGY